MQVQNPVFSATSNSQRCILIHFLYDVDVYSWMDVAVDVDL